MMLSLILATFGRCDDVERCLRSLIAQSDSRFEVLVIDQNADDRLRGPVERAAATGLRISHLKQVVPNLSAARNLGLAHAHGEFVAFPDDDCWYEPDTVMNALIAFEADPGLDGLVADWVEQSAPQGGPQEGGPLSLSEWRRFRGVDASSIALFIRRSAFDTTGGFDERFGVGQWFGGGEETDLVLRSLSLGARFERHPAVRVHHPNTAVPQGSIEAIWRKSRHRARGTGGLYIKHRLGGYVLVRGLIGSVAKPLFRLAGWRAIVQGAGIAVGLTEGAIRWRCNAVARVEACGSQSPPA